MVIVIEQSLYCISKYLFIIHSFLYNYLGGGQENKRKSHWISTYADQCFWLYSVHQNAFCLRDAINHFKPDLVFIKSQNFNRNQMYIPFEGNKIKLKIASSRKSIAHKCQCKSLSRSYYIVTGSVILVSWIPQANNQPRSVLNLDTFGLGRWGWDPKHCWSQMLLMKTWAFDSRIRDATRASFRWRNCIQHRPD